MSKTRTIKFKGFSIKDNIWIYGDLCTFTSSIRCESGKIDNVYPESISQYIGVQDLLGNDIYENDYMILSKMYTDKRWGYHKKNPVQRVVFKNGGFMAEDEDFGYEGEGCISLHMCEVQGPSYKQPK